MEQNSTVQKAIKSSNLTALVLAAIAILLLALLVAFNIKPLYNHFTGPFEVSSEELISYQGPQDTFRTYVTTYPIMVLDTSYYLFEKLDNGTKFISHSYYALLFDDRLLLAKFPGSGRGDDLQPGPVTGKIVRLTNEEKIQVLEALKEEYPNLKEVFLPYLLDTTADYGSVWLSIVGIAILFVFSVLSLVNLIRCSVDQQQVPADTENLVENDFPEQDPDQIQEQDQSAGTSS